MVIFNDHFFLLQRACKLHSGIFSRILPSITKFSSFQVVKIFFLRDSGLCPAPALRPFFKLAQISPFLKDHFALRETEDGVSTCVFFFNTEKKFCIKTTPQTQMIKKKKLILVIWHYFFISLYYSYIEL